MPNILTAKQACNLRNSHLDIPTHARRPGDVVRCNHGFVLVFHWNRFYGSSWERLHPVATPVRYRRAVKALKEARDA